MGLPGADGGCRVKGSWEVRVLYEGERPCAPGLAWLSAPTRWPVSRRLVDWAYRIFPRNRLRWTGRDNKSEDGRCQTTRTSQPADL